ncbi:transcription termination factor NusA [Rickettsia endosymbiont of Cardiosporidium cionae]|uniref:transcription termination factor NusA n=1 Tax=Rickettsia endosymbiont of Cardiosporidium cionae TaxID=2777155 RepID=UPI0018957D54|nr:transcription termination factor NusA [Rickettsia endosymbiont of Cardiosporidium cionae]KAF8818909.1 transcription termination/antitermination protein NusA [Rickettsia endosymbiont of Cardiosporidium cionae]
MSNIGNIEILSTVESVSRDKGIPKVQLIESIAQAIEAAAYKKYGNEYNLKAHINHNTGEIKLVRLLEIVENINDTCKQISLQESLMKNPNSKLGDILTEEIPFFDFGRTAAQAAKNVITDKIKEIERIRQYEDFKHRKGDIVNGIVKRVEFGNIIVDLGRAEAILKKAQQIPGEKYKINDKIKAYLYDVSLESSGFQIFLSRTDNEFLAKLLKMEVTEIYDGVVEIKAISRDPGSKAKISVFSRDTHIDPLSSCIGIKGKRIKSVINELNGEKIDIVTWDNDLARYIINSMKPAVVTKIIFHEDKKYAETVVASDQLSIAIGRQGQNVRLASKLTGCDIDVITEEAESKKSTEEFKALTDLFVNELKIDSTIAQLLISQGYNKIDYIAWASDDDFLSISELFDKELINKIRSKATNCLEIKHNQILDTLEKLGVEQELIDALHDIDPEYILKIAEYGIKNIEDISTMTVKAFRDIIPKKVMHYNEIKELINRAKQQVN